MDKIPLETFLAIAQPFSSPDESRSDHQKRVVLWASLNRWTANTLRPLIYTELLLSCRASTVSDQLDYIQACPDATHWTRTIVVSGLVSPSFDAAVQRPISPPQAERLFSLLPNLEDLHLSYFDLVMPRGPTPPLPLNPPSLLRHVTLKNIEVHNDNLLIDLLNSLPEVEVMEITRVRWSRALNGTPRTLRRLPRALFVADAYGLPHPTSSDPGQALPIFAAQPPPSSAFHHLHLESSHRLYPLDKAIGGWRAIPAPFLANLRSLSIAVDLSWVHEPGINTRLSEAVAHLVTSAAGRLSTVYLHITPNTSPYPPPSSTLLDIHWITIARACAANANVRILEVCVITRNVDSLSDYLEHVSVLTSPYIRSTCIALTPVEWHERFQSPSYRRLS